MCHWNISKVLMFSKTVMLWDVGVTCIHVVNQACMCLIKHYLQRLWYKTLFLELSYFLREEPEMVEALDIEEGGDEDYWANTVILRQTVLFYLFLPLNVIILSSCFLRWGEVFRGQNVWREICSVGGFIGAKIAVVLSSRANKVVPQYLLRVTLFHIKRKYSA